MFVLITNMNNNFYLITIVQIKRYKYENEEDEFFVKNYTFSDRDSTLAWLDKHSYNTGTTSFYDLNYARQIITHVNIGYVDRFDEDAFKFDLNGIVGFE